MLYLQIFNGRHYIVFTISASGLLLKSHGNRYTTVTIKCKNERCECSHDTTGKMTWFFFSGRRGRALNWIRTLKFLDSNLKIFANFSLHILTKKKECIYKTKKTTECSRLEFAIKKIMTCFFLDWISLKLYLLACRRRGCLIVRIERSKNVRRSRKKSNEKKSKEDN